MIYQDVRNTLLNEKEGNKPTRGHEDHMFC